MPGHDIIVLGASAGGVDAFITLARTLPPALPAAIFVVQHIPASAPSMLPEILARAGALPASHPQTGTPIEHGHIYVAPPDHHMIIGRGHVHVVRGPKENGFRPAIDATLRTAARAYGPRVVGVVLTGLLDDGTAGLLAVKRWDGVAVVQDPEEAIHRSMPESALRYVNVDAVCTLTKLSPLLVRLAYEHVDEGVFMSDIEESNGDLAHAAHDPAEQSQMQIVPFSCPDCGGVLMEFYDGELLRFRCQVGHVFSRKSAMESQAAMLDNAIWSAYRALNERATLAQRLARDAQQIGDAQGERRFAQLAAQAEYQKEQLHEMMVDQR